MFSVMFVCLSVCVSVCVSICLSICVSICSGYNFWNTSHRDFNFGMRYIFTISRSRSFCQSQGHMRRNDNFTYCNMLILYRSLIRSRSHIKVKVTSKSNIYILYVARTLCKRVVCIQLNAFMFPFHTKIFWDNRCGHWSLLVTLYVFLSSFNQIMLLNDTQIVIIV